ncbi:50S ribosomal protein L21 [Fretibacterium sp. OH1220_COT-178]|uniref:50S ribosomal protein L21 n=1 Tax=Fretibacterium sp. OH1220_COT-178 TaxID=2491047 RepID=UPI000F5ED9BD|nr:50S ribosomal protein L21 [Fretibacterium sp. OH1220_COT-178]RRD66209.1 50S ribosomal protein L21 [Fretibacterium sp. OH1220_COT-178]
MYAVLETGGKQYRVQVGDRFRVERLEGGVGDEVVLDKVLMVGGDGGTKFGAPYVSGAGVRAEILAQARDKKVLVFKYKSKKNYRRLRGHRQYFTEIVIRGIDG